MRALCMVAHPDDCVIFAYSLMHHLDDIQWHVAYLTYHDSDARYQELQKFWGARSVSTQCLGYKDDYRDIENHTCSFDTVQADIDIGKLCAHYDIVLTHSADGDYGHLHHIFVHGSVVRHHPLVITFAAPGQGTHHYELDTTAYDINELPMHGSIVWDFHRDGHRNSYHVPDAVQQLLGDLL